MANTGGLAAAGNSGSQTATQDPQNSTQTASLGQSQNVQTGTATSLLNGHDGVPLHGTAVSSVSLTAAATVRTAPPTPTTSNHGTNPVLFGFSVVLFVAAIALFWNTSRPNSVKSTTK
jgi:hypothetical protein